MFSRQVLVIPTFGSSVNLIFVLFQLHRNRGVKAGYHILPWGESQTLVFHALNTIISYLQDPTFFGAQLLSCWAKRVFFYYYLVATVTIETVGFKPRQSLILEMNVLFLFGLFAQKAKLVKRYAGNNFSNGKTGIMRLRL